VYAEEKQKYVAYPGLAVPSDIKRIEDRLVQDLEHIAITHAGEYKLTKEAIDWGTVWYKKHYSERPDGLEDDRFGGYIARKQTHIHKLAMVLAAAVRDNLTIEADDLAVANTMVTDLEAGMPLVFAKIGRTDVSAQTERFIMFIRRRKAVPYTEAYRFLHQITPSARECGELLQGCINAGFVQMQVRGSVTWVVSVDKPTPVISLAEKKAAQGGE
jgi:hypothetical protein